jgi:PA14 domain-containing protein
MILILLDDSAKSGDGEVIADAIVERGGSVPVVFDGEAVLAYFPADEPLSEIARLPHAHRVFRQAVGLEDAQGHHQAAAAVRYFKAAKSGELLKNLLETNKLPPVELGHDAFSPPQSTDTATATMTGSPRGDEGPVSRKVHTAPFWYGRNASMNGRIYSSIFFVQCSGSTECRFPWNQTDVDDVTNRIVTGYQYWSDIGQRYGKGIVFTVRTYSPTYTPYVAVPVEPVLHPSGYLPNGLEGTDSLWVDPIMANFGYASGNEWARVRAFNAAILAGNSGLFSSASCTFVGNNTGSLGGSTTCVFGGGNGAGTYAWLGNFENVLSNPFCNRPYLSALAAHETGHVFWACDEYSDPGYFVCSCAVCNNQSPDDRPPGNNIANLNCEVGCGSPLVGCIMRDAQSAYLGRQICSYTAQHLGWPAYPCFPAVGTYNWSATYYNDVYDAGTGTYSHWTQGAMARYDEGTGFINHDWGTGSPSAGNCPVNSDHFSARYSRYVTFTEGDYTFTATTDDGVLVMFDSTTIIDAQFDQPPTTYSNTVHITAGTHLLKVYYYDSGGGATLHVSWN